MKVSISGSPLVSRPRKGLSITTIPVKDDTGLIYLVWFNQEYVANSLKIGECIKVHGKIKKNARGIQISNPIFDKGINNKDEKIGRIIPIYALTEKLNNNEILKLIEKALMEYVDIVDEILPHDIRKKLDLWSMKDALKNIHFPKNKESYLKAKERLVFEEFLILQLGLLIMKNKNKKSLDGIKFKKTKEIDNFIDSLEFELTNAQKRVVDEVIKDMESNKMMNRLVQGDVGSGKTIVAILAILKAVLSGYQAVMMAPTEILAQQHYESINELFEKYNIKSELLVGSITEKKKQDMLCNIKEGNIDVIIGTHALIQDAVEFKNLGLAITDEQHRFGVKQRAVLSQKGYNPDIIVMTATPIPRTLALILYGDLDISVIDELPPGRKKIETYAIKNSMRKRAYNFVKKQVEEGRQGYIVCPLVEESEMIKVQSAIELYEELKKEYLKNIKLGLLHGKMKSKEKDRIMNMFKNKEIDVLISTTVIEVGVNVPNANIMLIENAERFGLAQLHQLRGRVGRGQYQSFCILINDGKSKVSKERMKIMEKTNDGFIISEKDLEIRGPGEFFGTRQHGLPELKIGNIFTDMETLKMSQKIASEILKEDPLLENPQNVKLRNKVQSTFKDRIDDLIMN